MRNIGIGTMILLIIPNTSGAHYLLEEYLIKK